MDYQVPAVSKYYRLDWNFALAASRIPLLRPASLIIGFMPLISKTTTGILGIQIAKIPPSTWLWWFSAVAFLGAWATLKIRCPNLIQLYRHYGDYVEYKHSHRWIVWQFHTMKNELRDWKLLVREVLKKGLTVDVQTVAPAQPVDPTVVDAYPPLIVGRDIFLPIQCDGEHRVLAMLEDDPKRPEKERELFWILFTQAAKERRCSRGLFWLLFVISVGILVYNVLRNIYLVAFPDGLLQALCHNL